jgi:transcriptional regulator with XRE-family HTH domain
LSQQKKSEKVRQFSERFRARMLRLGIQQNELASRLGIGPSAVNNWWQGENMAKLSMLRKIADELGVSIEWLTGEDAVYPPHQDMTPTMQDQAAECLKKLESLSPERRKLALDLIDQLSAPMVSERLIAETREYAKAKAKVKPNPHPDPELPNK